MQAFEEIPEIIWTNMGQTSFIMLKYLCKNYNNDCN